MEVARILKKIGPLKRTIVFAFWGAEEMGVYGSTSYANRYFGNLDKEIFNVQSEKVSAYLNLDKGSGNIRGLYLQGNENAKPFFKKILRNLSDSDSNALSLQSSLGVDHMIFDLIGIPSFQFIQDLNGYFYFTHHTNIDSYEYLIEDDLRQNVSIIAKLTYLLAQDDEMVPRK